MAMTSIQMTLFEKGNGVREPDGWAVGTVVHLG